MKCPKCGFNSFESHDKCKKCGKDLSAFKAAYNIRALVHPRKAVHPEAESLPAAAAPPEPATPKVQTPLHAAAVAAAAPEAEEFAFDVLPPEPTPVAAIGASVEQPPKASPTEEAPRGEFSLDDFIHFSQLNSGKGVEPSHSFGKGGFDLEDLFPAEQPQSREVAPPAQPLPLVQEPEETTGKPKAPEWLE